jgi:hypothetical protein
LEILLTNFRKFPANFSLTITLPTYNPTIHLIFFQIKQR